MPALLDLYASIAPLKPLHARATLLQISRSETEGWFVGERLVAAAMFYPLPAVHPGERHVELAFACRPELRDHLVPFIHAAELTRARLASNGPVRVRALVRTDHRPGARLAVLCGMARTSRGSAFDVWEYEGAPDEIRRWHQITDLRA
jgi:hypothetical protein